MGVGMPRAQVGNVLTDRLYETVAPAAILDARAEEDRPDEREFLVQFTVRTWALPGDPVRMRCGPPLTCPPPAPPVHPRRLASFPRNNCRCRRETLPAGASPWPQNHRVLHAAAFPPLSLPTHPPTGRSGR